MRGALWGSRSSGSMNVCVEVRQRSLGISETTVSFVFEVCCLISFWRVPAWAEETQAVT